MLAPSTSFSTFVQGLLLLSTLLSTAQATNPWATAPNTAVFYCGEAADKKTTTGTKAFLWASKGSKTGMYAKAGRPEYQNMQTINMVPEAKKPGVRIGKAQSKLFAEGAQGIVRLFEDKLSADGKETGVWKVDEEPALLANPRVTALHVINPDDKDALEYIVWERKNGKVVYRDPKHTVTGVPISRLDLEDLAYIPQTPPGSPKGSPKASPPGSPKAAPKVLPKAGSSSRSASKSPTRSTGHKVRRSRQFKA